MTMISILLYIREIHDEEIEEEIREAFRVFDREGHGFITVPDLSEVLQKLGEKLSTEECEVGLLNVLRCMPESYLKNEIFVQK